MTTSKEEYLRAMQSLVTISTAQDGAAQAVAVLYDRLLAAEAARDAAIKEIAKWSRRCGSLEARIEEVLERWDSPKWKDAEPTATVMNRLRKALENKP